MKVFATNYLEAWSDDIDGSNDWTWKPHQPFDKIIGSGRRTATQMMTCPQGPDVKDYDMPQEGVIGA